MEKALVVSSGDSARRVLTEALTALDCEYDLALGAREAADWLARHSYAVVLISAPIDGASAREMAEYATKKSLAVVVVFEKSGADSLEQLGAIVIKSPASMQRITEAIRHALIAFRRMNNLKMENQRLQFKLDEVRLVSRAKVTLVQHLNMTEAQAHRYIEKQAMDLQITRTEVAKNVLKNYSL